MAKHLQDNKRFVALMFDEMSIRGDLVYDHRGGQLIGFTNPNEWNLHQVVCNNCIIIYYIKVTLLNIQ